MVFLMAGNKQQACMNFTWKSWNGLTSVRQFHFTWTRMYRYKYGRNGFYRNECVRSIRSLRPNNNNTKLIHLWSMCAAQYLLDFIRLSLSIDKCRTRTFKQTCAGPTNERKKRIKEKKEEVEDGENGTKESTEVNGSCSVCVCANKVNFGCDCDMLTVSVVIVIVRILCYCVQSK